MKTSYFVDYEWNLDNCGFRTNLVFAQLNPSAPPERFIPTEVTPRTVRRIQAEKSQRAVFFAKNRFSDLCNTARRIKKRMPEMDVVLAGPISNFRESVEAMKAGELDMMITADTLEVVKGQLEAWPQVRPGARVYWRDSQGVIQWTKKETEVKNEKGKTLLVLMPAWNNDYAPFGLAHISAALKNANYPVKCLDLNWQFWQYANKNIENPSTFQDVVMWHIHKKYVSKARPHLETIFKTLRKEIETGEYSYVGFSLFDSNRHASVDACNLIREIDPNIKLFAGGPSCTNDAPSYIAQHLHSNAFDAAVFGEGEISVVKLLDKWESNSPEEVAGTWIREAEGKILKGATRPLTDINTLPFPDFSDFPIYNYDQWMMPLYYSRGCVAKCAFCAETKYWVRFRILKPEKLVEIVQRMTDEFGITHFRFGDSLLNGSHKHLEKFVDSVIEQKMDISFVGYCRLENDLTKELLVKMKNAGCNLISFGLESASQKVTDLMNKEVDVRNYERIIKDTSASGINVLCCVMIGFPGENWWDFFQTAKTLFKLRTSIHTLNLNIMAPAAQVAKDAAEMDRLGVDDSNIAIDKWRTKDGKNTPAVRLMRFWMLVNMWRIMKARDVSPQNWYYAARKRSKFGIFKESKDLETPMALPAVPAN